MQFKVPQNIDMADRIVGPLTLVQFLYLLTGGIVIYFLLSTVQPVNSTLFVALALPIGLLSLAMAFLKVQDQPFPHFFVAFIYFLFSPKTRVWIKTGHEEELIVPDKMKKPEAVRRKNVKKSELEQLVQTLDTAGRPPKSSAAPMAPPNYLRRGRPVLDNLKRG